MGQHKWVFIGICYSVILIRRKIYIYNEIHGHYQFSWLLIYLSAGAIHLLWTAVLRVWYLCAQEQYIPKLVVFGMANILSARANINEKFLKNSSFQHSNTLMGITISSDLVQKQILGRIQKREVFLNPSLQDFGYFVVSFWCLLAFINGINTVSLFTAHSTCIQNQHCSKQTCMQFEMLGCWNWELPSSFVTQQSHLFETVKMIQMMQNLYNVSGNWLIRANWTSPAPSFEPCAARPSFLHWQGFSPQQCLCCGQAGAEKYLTVDDLNAGKRPFSCRPWSKSQRGMLELLT